MKKQVCIAISEQSMRCVEVSVTQGGYSASKAVTIPIKFKVGSQEPDQRDISDVKFALEGAGISMNKAIIFLQDTGIIHRNIETPRLEEEELISFIRLNSKEYFPMEITDYVINGKVIYKSQEQQSVCISLVSKELLRKYQTTFKLLQFKEIAYTFTHGVPKDLQGNHKEYSTIAILDNSIQFQYMKENKVVYTKNELLSDMDNGSSGALVRFDDYLSNHYEKSLYNLPCLVFGNDEQKNLLESQLIDLFNNNPGFQIFDDRIISPYEYGYLQQLPLYKKKGKYLKDSVEILHTSVEIRTNIIAMIVLLLFFISSIGAVIHLGYIQPKKELALMTSTYDNLVVIEKDFLQQEENSEQKSELEIQELMDSYNNHFFKLIEELRTKMPRGFLIESIGITENTIRLTITLETMEDCSIALEQLDHLQYADPGEVTNVSPHGEAYSFTITLNYTEEIKK